MLFKRLIQITIVGLVFALSPPGATNAWSHAGEGILPVRLVVTEWASALQGVDAGVIADVLSDQFPDKDQYIATLPLTPITRVDLRHATLNIKGDTATFTPVVIFPMVNMLNPHALSLTLKQEDDHDWKITSITPTPDIPDELKIKN